MALSIRFFAYALIAILVLFGKAQAQVAISAISPNPVCTGKSLTITYSTTQAGTLSVYLSSGSTNLKLTERQTTAGANQVVTSNIASNQAGGQYNVYLVNVLPTGTPSSYTSNTISVGVTSTPALPTVTTPVPYCQNIVAVLLSATPASNHILRWYGMNSTGGSFSLTPSAPSTDQAGTFTYYVSQVNASGCESERAPILVTVNPKPTKPVTTPLKACTNAPPPSITSGVNGATGTLKWYTQETGGSPIQMPVLTATTAGTVTYYVSQTNQFGCESDRAAISYTVNGSPSTPTIPSQTTLYCQSATAASLQATASPGGTLRWYTASAGGSPQASLIPQTTNTGTTPYYVSQLDANGCESSRASLTVTVNPKPARPTVTASQSACQNTTPISLTATGTNLKWYSDASSATPIPTTSVSTATPGVFTYFVSQTDANGCESDRSSSSVTVVATPAPPTTAPVFYCLNSPPAPLTATPTAGGSLNWYTASSGGSPTTAITPVTSATGTTPYYVTQSVSGCESSSRASLAVTVRPLPAAPSVSASSVALCQGTVAAPLQATASAGGTLRWYTASAGGSPQASLIPQTTNTGTTPYYVSQLDANGCESSRASLTVTINPKPARPTVTASQSACQNTNPISLTATGTNLKWYSDASSATPIATPTVSTTAPGLFTYFVSQTDANGCESDRASSSVTVVATPAPPTTAPVFYCLNSPAVPLTATPTAGGSLNWYTASSGGSPTTAITPVTSATGTTPYYVSQSVSGCESSSRASLAVTVRPLPAAPSVSASSVALCQGTVAAPLQATASAGGTLRWYTASAGGSPQASLIPQTTNTGTTPYYVSQLDANGCESSRASLTVTVNPKPARPTVTASQSACQNTNPITLPATGTNLKWYSDASSATPIATPTISTTAPGVFTYFVSQTDANGCESDRASSSVTVVATPAPPTTAPVFYCLNSPPAPLTATPTAGGSLNWYTASSGGSPTTAITPVTSATGTTPYYVTQSVSGCESSSRASLDVTVRPLPAAPSVSASSVALCQGTVAAPLQATASAGGTLQWYTASSGGSPQASLIPQTSTTGLSAYYVSQLDANGCESPRTQVSVNVKSRPIVPIVGTTAITFCQNTPATALTAVTSGSQNWYTVPENGTPAPSLVPSTANPGQSTYFVSQTVDGCESARVPVVVTVQPTPLVPTVSDNPIYCQSSTGTVSPLSASAPNGGTLLWYSQEIGGIGTATPPVPPVSNAGTVTYYVSQSVNGCESQRVKLTATIKLPPDVPTVIPEVTACQSGTAVLTATLKGGVSLNWYTAATGGSVSTLAPIPNTAQPGQFFYYVSQVDANGCESSRASITLKVSAKPVAPSVSSVSFCQGATATPLNVTPNGGTLKWYDSPIGGVAAPLTPTPNTANPGVIPYYVSQADINGCESDRSVLLVTVAPTPAAPAVMPLATVCQNSEPVVLTAAGSNLKWYSDETSTTISPSILQTNQAGTFNFFVSQTVNTCESPRARITAVVNPVPSVPVVVPSQTGCQDAVVQPLTAVGTNLQWYDQNDNLISPPTPITRVDIVQIYTYKVSQTLNGCSSLKATVLYTVNVTPTPVVVSPVSFCEGSAPQPLQATGTNLKWYDPTGAVTVNPPTPSTAAVSTGMSYSVSQTSTLGCESRKAEIKTTITALPTAKLDGNPVIYLGSSAVLMMTLTGVGPYSYTLSEGTTGTIESATNSTTTVRSLTITPSVSTTYTIASIANACGTGTATGSAVVTVNLPTVSTAPLAVTTICSGTPLIVPFSTTGNFAVGNSFTVEIANTADDSLTRRYIPVSSAAVQGAEITARIPPTIAAGQYYVRVVAANGRYPISGTRSPTVLTIKPSPTVALSVSQPVIYNSESATLTLTFTGDPVWVGNYIATSSTGPVSNSFTSGTNVLSIPIKPTATTTYKLVNVSNTVCGAGTIAGVDSAKVEVRLLTAVEDPLSSFLKVYPVPTDGPVTVEVNEPIRNEPLQLRLISPEGRVIKEISTKQQQTVFYLDKEPAGTYLLHMKAGDRSTVRRILKR